MAETPGKMYALATVLTLLATGAVAFRLKARRLRKADLAWDDYTVFLALVSDESLLYLTPEMSAESRAQMFTYGTAICMFVGKSLT